MSKAEITYNNRETVAEMAKTWFTKWPSLTQGMQDLYQSEKFSFNERICFDQCLNSLCFMSVKQKKNKNTFNMHKIFLIYPKALTDDVTIPSTNEQNTFKLWT